MDKMKDKTHESSQYRLCEPQPSVQQLTAGKHFVFIGSEWCEYRPGCMFVGWYGKSSYGVPVLTALRLGCKVYERIPEEPPQPREWKIHVGRTVNSLSFHDLPGEIPAGTYILIPEATYDDLTRLDR